MQQIEIRTAKPEELDEVLKLMCESFDISYNAAYSIFYEDPYLNADDKALLFCDGKLASCLSLSTHICRIGRADIPIAAISGVASHPLYRKRGYAAKLLKYAETLIAERGFGLASLLADDFNFYRHRGWECIGELFRMKLPLASLPAYSLSPYLRSAELDDARILADAWDAVYSNQSLALKRNEVKWRQILKRKSISSYLYINGKGQLEGWLLYEVKPGNLSMNGEEAQSPSLRLLEMVFLSGSAKLAILGQLTNVKNIPVLEYDTGFTGLISSPLVNYDPEYSLTMTVERIHGCMGKAVDFKTLLSSLLPNWEQELSSAFGICIEKSESAGCQEEVLLLNRKGSVCNIKAISQEESLKCEYTVSGSPQIWVQVITGLISGEAAASLGRLHVSCDSCIPILESLFPYRAPSLPVLDNF